MTTMIYDHNSNKYPRYYSKYGTGDNIREEYLIGLGGELEKLKHHNRADLDLKDTLLEELSLALEEDERPFDSFIERVDIAIEETNASTSFLINLGFMFEDYRLPDRTLDDESSYGTIVKNHVFVKVKI